MVGWETVWEVEKQRGSGAAQGLGWRLWCGIFRLGLREELGMLFLLSSWEPELTSWLGSFPCEVPSEGEKNNSDAG